MARHSDIRGSWDSIPTQSQSDLARKNISYHQSAAFDEKQVNNGKRGRNGHFISAVEARTPDKVRYSDSDNANLAKARIRDMRKGDRAATEYLGTYHPVYENPQDRVFRGGEWKTIKELNAPLKKAKAAKPRRKKRKASKNIGGNPALDTRKRKMQAVTY